MQDGDRARELNAERVPVKLELYRVVRVHEHERGAGSMMTGGNLRAFHATCAQRQNSPTDAGGKGGSDWSRNVHASRSCESGCGLSAFAPACLDNFLPRASSAIG